MKLYPFKYYAIKKQKRKEKKEIIIEINKRKEISKERKKCSAVA